MNRKLDGATELVLMFLRRKNSFDRTGTRTPNRVVRSTSLNRLSYSTFALLNNHLQGVSMSIFIKRNLPRFPADTTSEVNEKMKMV